MNTRKINLTPKRAQQYVNHAMPNRPVNPNWYRSFAADIEAGRWDTETIIIVNEDGRLIDGLHRCYAVIEAGKSIPVIEATASDNMFRVLDQGQPRSLAQVLTTLGYEHNVSMLAASINAASTLEVINVTGYHSRVHPVGRRRYTMSERLLVLDAHKDLADQVIAVRKVASGATVSIKYGWVAGLRSVASAIDADDLFDWMLYGVAIGQDLNDDDPAFRLRTRLLKDRNVVGASQQTITTESLWSRTWAHTFNGAHIKALYAKKTKGQSPFPTPPGLEEWAENPLGLPIPEKKGRKVTS